VAARWLHGDDFFGAFQRPLYRATRRATFAHGASVASTTTKGCHRRLRARQRPKNARCEDAPRQGDDRRGVSDETAGRVEADRVATSGPSFDLREIYSHAIHGQDDDAARLWEEYRQRSRPSQPTKNVQ
jgi:hypothetical protein